MVPETVDEIDQAAADALDGRDVQLHGTRRRWPGPGAKRQRALIGPGGVGDAERHRARAGAVLAGEGLREAVGLGIDDEVETALAMQRHVLGAVPGDDGEPHPLEQVTQPGRIGRGVFDELKALRSHRVGRGNGLATRCCTC